MLELDPRSAAFWIPVAVSVGCGLVIGLERQLRGKVVGVRTSILVCMSTALFVQLGQSLAGPAADPSRVVGQVVTGVGFLGAGVILARGTQLIGVTTAAVIWMLAAIGSTIGFGYYLAALTLTGVATLVLVGGDGIEILLRRLTGRDAPAQEE